MSETCTGAACPGWHGLRFSSSGVRSEQECALALRWLQRACQLASGPCMPSQHKAVARRPKGTYLPCTYCSTGAELGILRAGGLGDTISVMQSLFEKKYQVLWSVCLCERSQLRVCAHKEEGVLSSHLAISGILVLWSVCLCERPQVRACAHGEEGVLSSHLAFLHYPAFWCCGQCACVSARKCVRALTRNNGVLSFHLALLHHPAFCFLRLV